MGLDLLTRVFTQHSPASLVQAKKWFPKGMAPAPEALATLKRDVLKVHTPALKLRRELSRARGQEAKLQEALVNNPRSQRLSDALAEVRREISELALEYKTERGLANNLLSHLGRHSPEEEMRFYRNTPLSKRLASFMHHRLVSNFRTGEDTYHQVQTEANKLQPVWRNARGLESPHQIEGFQKLPAKMRDDYLRNVTDDV